MPIRRPRKIILHTRPHRGHAQDNRLPILARVADAIAGAGIRFRQRIRRGRKPRA